MKLNLNFPIKNLDGTDIPDSNAAKIIAQNLFFSDEKENALKFHSWAIKLYAGEAIELDAQDETVFRAFLKKVPLPVVTYVAILNAIK